MFDLLKDIERYKGITPYASEHHGVYQPILGWESKLTKDWILRGGSLIDPPVERILDGRILPGPTTVGYNDPREFLATPLEPGVGKSPFKVLLLKDLNSEVLRDVQRKVQAFVESHDGRLPVDNEWVEVVDFNDFMDPENGALRKANDIHRTKLFAELQAKSPGGIITEAMTIGAQARHLELMQYESQIATFLLWNASNEAGMTTDNMKQIFAVTEAPPLTEMFRSTDPLATIDPLDRSGVLSPVGFMHLFRQYFFDLGTFLGEPVEHIWLAPGTSIELIEVSTRKAIVERTEETAQDMTTRTESSSAVKDELSDAIKAENSSSTKLGVSASSSGNFGVVQGTASASLGLESARKDARENTLKNTREQSEKLSTEIKNSYKSVFKTVTETTDTRSRRYVLQNPTPKLFNYELRRKMRRVGVQMQGLGERLCWQVFVDDAGGGLGLSEMVHFTQSPDLASLKQLEVEPPPALITKTVSPPIPFIGMRTNDDNGPGADYGNTREIEAFDGKHHGNRTNTNDEDAADAEIVMGPFPYTFAPPQGNYFLSEVRVLGPQGGKRAAIREPVTISDNVSGAFNLVLESVNFGGSNQMLLDVELVFSPNLGAFAEYEARKKKAEEQYDAEKQRLLEKSYMESVRKRIKDESNIKPRPSWDLREEERTVIYRSLVERLMLDTWAIAKKSPKDGNNSRLSHVRSEIIRAIFDVDAMLYFVAPEWWMPRRHKSANTGDTTFALTDADLVKWGQVEKRDDNYKITEESTVARLGSSLGWLLQLDGDNLRNAFLNAPWVKAVIPIRAGREKAALNWLRAIEGHDNDGWDAHYTPTNAEDRLLVAELEAEGNEATIGNVLEKIAQRLELVNTDIENTLQADKVFERGFDHLAGGFDAGIPANEPYTQWITILPTDQIAAVEYEPTTLFEA
ncbi:hypothetical protein SAMN04487916_108158 [Arthrobacter sp. ov407]|uniref:hypothetical protein n=1 Tax=Arthrobacter sp. ov407 TaxID=1761748 RepID=UPI000882F043|nr:hypothetical protein [Arthrobacter sp. ov407]SDL39083.1 hypothetical protein SAMN04487916_108158 [Arthrobacter sp. ov407]